MFPSTDAPAPSLRAALRQAAELTVAFATLESYTLDDVLPARPLVLAAGTSGPTDGRRPPRGVVDSPPTERSLTTSRREPLTVAGTAGRRTACAVEQRVAARRRPATSADALLRHAAEASGAPTDRSSRVPFDVELLDPQDDVFGALAAATREAAAHVLRASGTLADYGLAVAGPVPGRTAAGERHGEERVAAPVVLSAASADRAPLPADAAEDGADVVPISRAASWTRDPCAATPAPYDVGELAAVSAGPSSTPVSLTPARRRRVARVAESQLSLLPAGSVG